MEISKSSRRFFSPAREIKLGNPVKMSWMTFDAKQATEFFLKQMGARRCRGQTSRASFVLCRHAARRSQRRIHRGPPYGKRRRAGDGRWSRRFHSVARQQSGVGGDGIAAQAGIGLPRHFCGTVGRGRGGTEKNGNSSGQFSKRKKPIRSSRGCSGE